MFAKPYQINFVIVNAAFPKKSVEVKTYAEERLASSRKTSCQAEADVR
jgi:hypothetical protein